MSRLHLIWIALFAVACNSAEDTEEVSEALTGQTGVLAVTAANTVVNQYGVLAANAPAGAMSITVTSLADFTATAPFTTGLAAGDLLMLYQPQGATIDATDTATYGNVSVLGGAGTYELVHVASVIGGTINLETGCGGLRFAYTTAGATQVIRVPQATTVTISGAGSIIAPTWDGARGGVVAVHAQSTATIGGAGINVTGRGFRGGAADDVTTNPPGTTTFRSAINASGAEKGEGIAGFQTRYDTAFNGRFGRGAPANGGGGGDAHNGGGGGGANGDNGSAYTGAGVMSNAVVGGAAWMVDPEFIANGNALTTSAGGGRGGYTFSGTDQNALMVAPGIASWGGDSRRNVGGRGGRPLAADPASRVFLGGGGGAGDGNNTAAGPGGAGGGLVVLIAPTVTGAGSILANGAPGTNSGHNPGDAPGGGGAGGSVIVRSTTLSGVTIRADGGAGGDQTLAANLEAEGPGGGGGGGFIATVGGAVTRSANGAIGGTTNVPTLTEFPSNGATSGATGVANATVTQLPICATDDLQITNTDGAATVVAGSVVTYTVTVTNAGADIVTGATVTETFPATLTGVTWTCAASAGSSCGGAAGAGNINATVTLANGGTVTYTITATVAPGATGTLSTTATVMAPAGFVDPVPGNNSATDLDQITVQSDLAIAITDSPDPVAAGGTETYTVTVTNLGPSTATGLTVTNTLPAGSTFTSAMGTGWACAAAALVVTCTRATLAPGAAPAISIVATMPGTAGMVTDTATVTSTSPDPTAPNNMATQTTTVTAFSDLSIAVTDAPDPVAAAGTETYTVTVTNLGPSSATGITVTNTLPAGSTFTSAMGTGWACSAAALVVSCTRASLAPGAAPAIAIVAVMPGTAGVVTDTATVTSTSADPNLTNNTAMQTTTVTTVADLTISLTDAPDPAFTGMAVTYMVSVTNVGPQAAANLTTTFGVPAGATFVSAAGTGWTCMIAGAVVTCTRPALAPGAAPAIGIVITAPATAGTISATATVSSTTTDPNAANNSATQMTVITNGGGDTDGDGTPNNVDLDDDDDGIPDTIENGGVPGADKDGDGVPNQLDLDSDNDGILDVIEVFANLADANRNGRLDCPGGTGTNGLCDDVETAPDSGVVDWNNDNLGPDTALNSDADAFPDFLDVDSDQDGVRDLDEGNSGCADTAPSDGRCDGADTDGDGVVNVRDATVGHGVTTYPDRPDTDADGMPDYRDRDADGDGLVDLIEANSACVDAAAPMGACDAADANMDGIADDAAATRPDTDGDGRPDYRDVDADGDGLRDGLEGIVDTDGDTRPDFRDLDSDNDGIPDVIEGSSGCADTTPRNGRCDGPDANNDGIADSATNQTPPDTDGDSAVDFRDLDTDNDGIPDRVEGGSNCLDTAPANAVCDGPDANGDGLADTAVLVAPPNGDLDPTPDYRDLDSDDDGLPDLTEGGSGCTDADGNAVCDGPDADRDGIADSIDGAATFGDPTPTVPTNTDGVDEPNYRDLDSNNDATFDLVTSGCIDLAVPMGRCDAPDTDGDGVVDQSDGFVGFGISSDLDGDGRGDSVDLDDDNDGIPDAVEGGQDTDGDGATDDRDLDSDNDGLPDVIEAGHGLADANHDGTVDCPGGFGTNGLCDAVETTPDSGMAKQPPIDTDSDGVADFRDLDSDDDGLPDRIENGADCLDVSRNSVCDGNDPDRDGIVTSADHTNGFGAGGYNDPPDTDGDGLPDYRDLDSDGDSIFDLDEAGHGMLDDNDDGMVDGPDPERDGIKTAVDADPGFGGGGSSLDTDGDGIPDQRDLDADGDGIPDVDEAGEDPTDPADTDGDGKPDFQDVDADNDTVTDAPDNCRLTVNTDQQDADGDGMGDECDPDDDNDGFMDGLGLSGGGCATGGEGASGVLVLVALGLLLTRRRRTSATLLGAMLVATLAARTASAQVATTYPAERFQLAAHRDGLLGVPWADVRGHLTIDAALWIGYENDPVNVYQMSSGDRVASLVANRFGGELVASIHLFDRLELDLGAPLIVSQSDDVGTFMNPNGDLSGFGLGDLRVTPKLTLVHDGRSPVSFAVLVAVTLPTSTSDDYGGETGATFSPAVVLSRGGKLGGRISIVGGYRVRPTSRALNLVVDDELFAQAGVGYRFANSVEIDGTFDLATAADDALGAFNRNHAEFRGGLSVDATRLVRLFAATGVGVAEGFGTPDWRLLAGVRVGTRSEPAKRKVIQIVEPPPPPPEDPDPDHDLMFGEADACPMDPEDVDSFEDTDGCPDPDNDKDTILDAEDACPDVPGVLIMKGCPDPDRDGDTVVDRIDNCPDEPGPVENQGCKAKQLVKIVDGRLDILDIVYFKLNKAIIEKRSNKLLDQVAAVLTAHPEITKIRIEGHTDNQGNDAYNKKLSQRRADAVMAYLIKKRVAADRLEAQGFGEEVPKEDNSTKEGRAVNRRVEFTIVGGPGVTVKPTGPDGSTLEP